MPTLQAQNGNWYQIIVVLMMATGEMFVQLPLHSERPTPTGSGMKGSGTTLAAWLKVNFLGRAVKHSNHVAFQEY